MRKPVFGVLDQVRLKAGCIEIITNFAYFVFLSSLVKWDNNSRSRILCMCVFIKQMGNSMHVCVALNKLGS